MKRQLRPILLAASLLTVAAADVYAQAGISSSVSFSTSNNSAYAVSSQPTSSSMTVAVDCAVTSVQTWGNSYQAAIEITNISAFEIQYWEAKIGLEEGHTIEHAWGTETSLEGGYLVVSNTDWNGQLGSGESVVLGVQGTYSGVFVEPICVQSDSVEMQQSSSSSNYYVDYSAVVNASYSIEGDTLFVDASKSKTLSGFKMDFGDGSEVEFGQLSVSQSSYDELIVNHTYQQPGNYAVELRGYSIPWGSVKYFNITIGPDNRAPIAEFDCEEEETSYISETSANLSVATYCSSNSTDPNGNTLLHTWDMGNGEVFQNTGEYPRGILYSEPGTYTVSLTVSDGEYSDTKTIQWLARSATGETQQSSSSSSSVSIEYQDPWVDVSYYVEGMTLYAEGQASSEVTDTEWDFGDGSEILQDEFVVSHTYAEPGDYEVIFRGIDYPWMSFKSFSISVGPQSSDIVCEYNLLSQWNTGFSAGVTITNNGESTINGWQVSLEFTGEEAISTAWSAIITADNPYQVSGHSYNAQILPGASVSFGFVGTKGEGEVETPKLGGDLCN